MANALFSPSILLAELIETVQVEIERTRIGTRTLGTDLSD